MENSYSVYEITGNGVRWWTKWYFVNKRFVALCNLFLKKNIILTNLRIACEVRVLPVHVTFNHTVRDPEVQN